MKNSKKYDVIIIGAGLSGLTLANEIITRTSKSVLILEKKKKFSNDKNWCFWNVPENPFTKYADNIWSKVVIKIDKKKKELESKGINYLRIKPLTFYKRILSSFKKRNVTILMNQKINHLNIDKNEKIIKSNNIEYKSNLIFDSRPNKIDNKKNRLFQHFYGFEVLFEKKVLDIDKITLMDFQCFSKGINFFYILPFSSRRALIETTYFSTTIYKSNKYKKDIINYIKKNFNGYNYKLISKEKGIIPMFYESNLRENKLIKIGLSGNWIRASTGYSFQNSFINAKMIVDNLISGKKEEIKIPKLIMFLDLIFCDFITKYPADSKYFFYCFFFKNNLTDIVNFLTGRTKFLKIFAMLLSLPKTKMILSLISLIKNKVKNNESY